MCISPTRIPNPNAGLSHIGLGFMKDCVSKYINVPCGHCPECIAHRQMDFVQRIQMEGLVNYLFFCTLTYNDEMIPKITTSTDYDIRFADVSHVQNMCKRLRKRNAFGRKFRYFGVSELGSNRGRPHFHLIFILPKNSDDTDLTPMVLEHLLFKEVLSEWRVNLATVWSKKKKKFIPDSRRPDYHPLCTYVRRMIRGQIRTNYDLHFVNPKFTDGGEADVGFYVVKYMLKPSDRVQRLQRALKLNLDDEEYEFIWNVVKPRHFESECFGLGQAVFVDDDKSKPIIHPKVLEHLKRGVLFAKDKFAYPCFINPVSGQTFPLSRYYYRFPEIYSLYDSLDFFYSPLNKTDKDNVVIRDDIHISQLLKSEDDFSKIVKIVDSRESASNFDELF